MYNNNPMFSYINTLYINFLINNKSYLTNFSDIVYNCCIVYIQLMSFLSILLYISDTLFIACNYNLLLTLFDNHLFIGLHFCIFYILMINKLFHPLSFLYQKTLYNLNNLFCRQHMFFLFFNLFDIALLMSLNFLYFRFTSFYFSW